MEDHDPGATVRPDQLYLYEIAAEQHGYFTAAQARDCGFSSRLLAHHVGGGRYERVRWGLYRLRSFPSRLRDEVAVVSHDRALDLLDLRDVIPDVVHPTAPPPASAGARRRLRTQAFNWMSYYLIYKSPGPHVRVPQIGGWE